MARWLPLQCVVVTAAPGTGSTSLIEAVDRLGGVQTIPESDVVIDGVTTVDQKHATVRELVAAGLFEPPPDLRIVTTVRNPFDFWPSEWERTRHRWVHELRDRDSWVYRQEGMVERIVDAIELDFPTWVIQALDGDLRAGRSHHLNDGHVREADVVLRMEHLTQDLTGILGVEIEVGHVNRTGQRRPYWQYYDRAARDAVEAVHQPTLDRFGYRF